MNVLIASLTLWLTYKSCKKFYPEDALWSILFVLAAPLYFAFIFSGLTEPMFALFFIAGIYFVLYGRINIALLIVSFMPFVRSEGLIIIGVFGLYLLYKKEFFKIPLLAVGHIVYGIIGLIYNDSPLWVFSKIPYNRLDSAYGSGIFLHFFNTLDNVIGVPLYILLGVGLLYMVITLFRYKQRKEKTYFVEELF